MWLDTLELVIRGELAGLRARVARAVEISDAQRCPRALAARLLLLAGDFDAALHAIAAAQAEAGGDADPEPLLIARAFAAGMLGDFGAAMQSFDELADRGASPWLLLAAADLAGRVESGELAMRWAARVEGHPEVRAEHLLRVAEILGRVGAHDAAVAAVQQALAADGADRLSAAGLLLASGACDAAEELLRAQLGGPRALESHRGLAMLHLWRAETAPALQHAKAAEDIETGDPGMRRVRAVADLLSGRTAAALAAFDELAALPTADAETHAWRAEALLRAGRPRDALVAARVAGDLSPDHSSYAALGIVETLAALELGRRPTADVTLARAVTQLCGTEAGAQLRRLVRRTAAGPLAVDRALAAVSLVPSPRAVTAALNHALAALGGNRAYATPTRADGNGLRPLRLAPPPRAEVKAALHAVRVGGFPAAAERLAALIERFPDWPHPLFYRAELYLWVGQLDAAQRDLEAALAKRRDPEIERGLWPRIGIAAVALLSGRPRAALRAIRRARWQSGGVPAEPYFAWRGEILRALGRLDAARAALARVCGEGSCRVGSLITLALTERDLGDREAARATLARVAALAPPLLLEVTRHADSPGVRDCLEPVAGLRRLNDDAVRDVLERALRAMRGNRSASCLTFVDAQERLCAIPPNRFHRFVHLTDDLRALRAAVAGW